MKKLKRVLVIFLACLLLLGLVPITERTAAAFTPEYSVIRVGINSPRFSWRVTPSVNLSNTGGLRLGSFNAQREFVPSSNTSFNNLQVSGSGANVVVRDGAGNTVHTGQTLAIAPVNANVTTTYTLPGANFAGGVGTTFHFFGGFRFTSAGGSLTVVNYVDIERYVQGVVPYEAIPSWPIEALKAQALTARTFAVASFGRRAAQGFDVANTVFCQVYRGTERANANTDRSVTETAGQIILHNGRPIEALYHSASGGATENSENVWTAARGYLIGVPNPHEETPAQFNWSRTFTPAEFRTHMRNRDSGFNLPDIVNVIPVYTAVGNMLSVTFVASNGNTRTYERGSARTVVLGGFTFNSQRFTITRSGPASALAFDSDDSEFVFCPNAEHTVVRDAELLPEDLWHIYYSQAELLYMAEAGLLPDSDEINFGFEDAYLEAAPQSGLTFTIRNFGWGHNVGMSQHGANSLARRGYTYVQIIHFYYTDVTISGVDGPPPPPPPPPPSSGFVDVPSGVWYYDAVRYVRDEGLMLGTSSTHFSPYANTTRGMFVTILGRMAGAGDLEWFHRGTVTGSMVNVRSGPGLNHHVLGSVPQGTTVRITGRSGDWYRVEIGSPATMSGYMSRDFVSAIPGTYSDVTAGAFYTPYVEWAADAGIVTGVGGGLFRPDQIMTRQEMATILHRYITVRGIAINQDTSVPPFADMNQVDSWAAEAVTALQRAGLIQGVGDNRFAPLDNSNRAGVANMIANFHQNYG